MNSTLYIQRNLINGDNIYTEDQLLATEKFIVILAEPGAGKTELLGSLARKLDVPVMTANFFGYIGSSVENCPLIIDAFDELSKIDNTGIHKLLANAKKANPTHVIISSRSSEWGTPSTNSFRDFLGHQPLVLKLCEFDESEQRAIFYNHAPGEDFYTFKAEISRFDLEPLLPNPQFLKLFADAYIESGRRFQDKRSIFTLAVERLAKEANENVTRTNRTLSITQKVNISEEVFAKLLLAGAEGVSTSELAEDRTYPLLHSLINSELEIDGILASRLFKPGDRADQHRPVHKIVAEYCAANYLTKKIASPTDPLTLPQCLAIIAPNSVVRDELRGLLGWMAALGSNQIQRVAIELDPYAVLANGDPSQIDHSAKRLLIKQLKEIEAKDPYFRRGDYWRRFSVAGFFTQEIVEDIKPILSCESNGHLQILILELLIDSSAVIFLKNELRQLVLDSAQSDGVRSLASECLLNLAGYDHKSDLSALTSKGDNRSLNIAARIIRHIGPDKFDATYLSDFLKLCAHLYPSRNNFRENVIGTRYFVKQLIHTFELPLIRQLLTLLTKGLACNCGKKYYECDCRIGTSKVVGLMLDRYFELETSQFEPECIWEWLKNLHYEEFRSASQSKAVQILQENEKLRQSIIRNVFENLNDREVIIETKLRKFDWHSHSGLSFQASDYIFIVDLAFETDNHALWSSFIATHQNHREKNKRGPDSLRRKMREHALLKPKFMREWSLRNRAAAAFLLEQAAHGSKHKRRMRRQKRKQNENRLANIKYVQENRELIESGRHFRSLARFAEFILFKPDEIEFEFGDETLIRTALANCIDFIAPLVPDLSKLAELHCTSQQKQSERILYAALMEIMNEKGTLESVNHETLKSFRVNVNTGYTAVPEEIRDALKSEVDKLIFPNIERAESFLRLYLEPQLANSNCSNPEIWLLRSDESFTKLRATLSIDWLKKFSELNFYALDCLFEIAAEHANREELKKIISLRCEEIMMKYPAPTEDNNIEQRRTFWLLRAWYFLDDVPNTYWDRLKADRETIHALYGRSGRFSFGDYSSWPKLSASKIEAILDAFIDKWPKVNLPSHWGTDSPKEENAYRFLTEVIWLIDSNDPDDAIPTLNRLLLDRRFIDMKNELQSIHAAQSRRKALRDFEPPTPKEIVDRLDHNSVVTVEGLRQLVLQELQDFQKAIDGGEFNSGDRFYEKGDRLGEVRSTEIIAERLNLRLEPQNISVTPEHQLKSANRSDFTVTKIIGGKRRLLVTEVKGQWHAELFTAASAQLHERYAIHPDAERQGIFLAIWFGSDEKVAGVKTHDIQNAVQLKERIEAALPSELVGLVDVFVLDVSKKK